MAKGERHNFNHRLRSGARRKSSLPSSRHFAKPLVVRCCPGCVTLQYHATFIESMYRRSVTVLPVGKSTTPLLSWAFVDNAYFAKLPLPVISSGLTFLSNTNDVIISGIATINITITSSSVAPAGEYSGLVNAVKIPPDKFNSQ